MPAATPVSADAKASSSFDVSTLFGADKAPAQALASQAKNGGPDFIAEIGFAAALKKALGDKKVVANKENALAVISTLLEQGAGPAIEPILVDVSEDGLFPILLDLFADKAKTVSTAAVTAVKSLVQVMSPWATAIILPSLLHQINTAGKWQIKTGSLTILDQLVKTSPEQMSKLMPEIVPVLAGAIWDTKADVKKAARTSLTTTTALVSNKDIEKFIPALISALINPVEEVPTTIQLLSATTFVSEVDSPTLSLMVPLLSRGITERLTATKRKVAVITDNMAKLVDNEYTVRPFIPKLLPALIKVSETVADPEARGVVNRAIATLRQVGNVPEGEDGSNLPPAPKAEPTACANAIVATYTKHDITPVPSAESLSVVYASKLAANLITARNFDQTAWETSLLPFLGFASGSANALKVVQEYLQKAASEIDTDTRVFEDEEEGEDLCNCTFSLAYGAKILLNTATLRLKRGHRYGLCGRNGSGKSTLMNAIVNGQVEGFPSKDIVRTWYVAHDIDGSEAEIGIYDWVLSDERISSVRTPAEIHETLAEVGFNDERQTHSIGSLSGGWKMKLALARAILFKADILLLDEPTNHLDVINVTWLIDYLTSLTHCTCIIVSHDSDFLNRSVTDIIHLNRFKIKRYPGNLEDFVRMVPEAKAYYSLSAADEYKFKLPNPPLLDGVKTKEKSLLKMRKVGFQYPTQPVQQLWDITLQISLSSRVAVLGPNGSGKSTLVKILIGDMEPNKGGEVWKHPNLVVGYVAQHAFHHIDMHLDKTPLDYLLWRYQTGEDLEELHKANRIITEEEAAKMKEGGVIVIEGVKRLIDEITSRKKLKQSYEYEVSFKGLSSSENLWLPRDELITRGFEKKVLELDTREAQRLGLLRPLVRREIEKHFEDFGLEAEFTSHNTMRGLSGGQKVKVVLGAATWRRPHVIMLDEPTNYLDRESLAALIEALKDFEGGVLVITHNREFSESICSEVWAMRDGHLEASGHNWVEGQGTGERIDKKPDEEEEKFDAMGNPIAKITKAVKKSAADLRKAKKDRMARRKRGEEVFTDEEL
ncbi:P-loop containing nucleoside triphosphate hydrolase protein [Mrakia frigida]|uniref:P-loop containing nucleoside triphosphate hydrolase protein n=1 Tax=Mrakia frigida TaxID=29902 RepID=UPI003FCC116B